MRNNAVVRIDQSEQHKAGKDFYRPGPGVERVMG
jgi:hypothetical protein